MMSQMHSMRRATVLGLVLAMLASVSGYAYDEAKVENGGSVSGAVLFEGTPPERKNLNIPPNVSDNPKALSEDVIVAKANDKQMLVNAVATLVGVEKGKPFSKDAPVLDQKLCVFVPHVVVVGAGMKLRILNSDDVNHNVHTLGDKNPESNKTTAPKAEISSTYAEPDRIPVRCDMHGWMKAYIVVVDNPYFAVTGESGAFKIDGIPPGTYKLTVWHEKLGEQTKEVVIKGGADTTVEYSFKAK